ncbi:VGLL1 protein, partial [Psilopogon haemacephalus]|nr:VGLL1 protein [Psilopogon haemacephalus]
MEETGKLSPKLCKSKEAVKTEWGSQSVVFTYFQGDINSVVDEHFSRALSNAKNPQDLSTRHKGEAVVLKNAGSVAPQQWNFSSHCSKPCPSASAASMADSGLGFPAAAAGQYPAAAVRSSPAQPGDLWPFPSMGAPSLSLYHHALPDLHAVEEPISGRKYGSLLGLLQQERCLTSMQECAVKQH